MKIVVILLAFILFFYCSQNGESPENSGDEVEEITLTINVTGVYDQPYNQGWVFMSADQWIYHARTAFWWTQEREETESLVNGGEVDFIFATNRINPDEPYVKIKELRIYNSDFEVVESDTTDFLLYSGEHRTVNFTVQ